ncbi:hypothetical protein BAUCODRAFT_74343 [Baudoinia panamericana UAMH 10762]|uniref:Uncharacterized protein n=1 Tax=Baudoinia panamericana (strain UAMH 10762) TaxID=717646 RepID=M2MC72_BAUPA|nr:uncharacterized protein BAUCODRAFT_74343 [Baudoinia panamericana UAMH 10762]EMC94101.1 hypothetical protein BAUCODRAFT_74343 [Baudoinia panamericana UAMH 10762]
MGASESKLTFKEDVFRLAREDNIPADDVWWAQFYQLPEHADDVFALWSPTDVRNLTLNGPDRPSPGAQVSPRKNLETLIYVCVARLDALQRKRCFADPHQPIAPEALNCMRILTRLLPYIYEADHLHVWEEKFFWQPRTPSQSWDTKRNRPGAYYDGLDPAKRFLVEETDGEHVSNRVIGPPLGEQLVDVMIRYMFFAGFTLPKRLDSQGLPDLKVAYHIWNSGIGCRQSAGMTRENEKNAAEAIRLLLSLCSRQMYIVPQLVAETDVKPISYMTLKPDRQVALSMICSLLNTVLKYNPATWRVPVDFATDGDPRSRLANLSLDLLLVLVLYPEPAGQSNAYRRAVSRLHRVEDFQFIQQGLMTVLMQPISGVTAYLAGKQVPWAPEMLILFWELLQVNKRFRAFIIETDRAHDFVVLVLFYAMGAKDQPTKQSIVRMCVLILQTMSVEPTFGSHLNKPFVGQESLPAQLRITNFHGTYADFLITSVHTLMTTTQGRLESIYPALLAIINNVAPYALEIQRATSSKLLDLFASLSSPTFLLEKEGNHHLLEQMLQIINAVLEHQLAANRRFVEVLVRSRKRFQILRDFTVEGALAELDRQAQERKERGEASLTSGVRSPQRNGSLDMGRSPVSARSPQLGNVPEHGAFAIGDDEDDQDDEAVNAAMTGSTSSLVPLSASTSNVDEALPLQSRGMSEKARGKQPVGEGSFSRSNSRNTSAASLPALNTTSSIVSTGMPTPLQPFQPTPEWLETWLPHLQLHTILEVIGQVRVRGDDITLPERIEVLASEDATAPKVQAFVWTSLSLGWYVSLLWGLIYASDVSSNKGIHGIWSSTSIKLFAVKMSAQTGSISLRSPQGAVDAIGNGIVQRLSSLSFQSSPTVREV